MPKWKGLHKMSEQKNGALPDGTWLVGQVMDAPAAFGKKPGNVKAYLRVGKTRVVEVAAWGEDGKTTDAGTALLAVEEGQRVAVRCGVRSTERGLAFSAYEVRPAA